MTEPKQDDAFFVHPMDEFGERQSGGVLRVSPDLPTLNTVSPRDFTFLLEWEAKKPTSCELQMQLQYQEPSLVASGFPDATYSYGFSAGARLDGSNVWDFADPIIAKYETGGGSNARVFYSDVRPGRFSLGVQQRVRMSIARWLQPDAGGGFIAVQGSIAACKFSDADPPTYTATTTIAAAASKQITSPPGALWWDFSTAQLGSQIRVTSFQGLYYKDTTIASPVQIPPVTPYPWLTGNSLLTVENVGALEATVTLQWWVR